MTDLIDTTEMYLRTILELEEDGQVVLRARISERLGQSGPTVSETVNRMSRDGLVIVNGDRHLELTEHGRLEAVRVMRKHRLAERLLADVIGLEWEFLHEEACRWEHVMSEQVERKILELIKTPTVSPYGNRIPGLEELGIVSNFDDATGSQSLPSKLAGTGQASDLKLARFGEPIQIDPEFLADLRDLGLLPGTRINASHIDGRIFVSLVGQENGLALDHDLAAHIFVED
ncbi:MAG: iron dependent repressor, metal binding and dimerization domain protein [Microbacteriaceae bacterium]